MSKKHNLSSNEIVKDDVVEITNPLHNYIRRKRIEIKEEDIIHELEYNPLGITDHNAIMDELEQLGVIVELEY